MAGQLETVGKKTRDFGQLEGFGDVVQFQFGRVNKRANSSAFPRAEVERTNGLQCYGYCTIIPNRERLAREMLSYPTTR